MVVSSLSPTQHATLPGGWTNPPRHAAQPRPFDDVRAQMHDESQSAQQAKAIAQFLARLLQKYAVVVEASIQPLLGPLTEVVR